MNVLTIKLKREMWEKLKFNYADYFIPAILLLLMIPIFVGYSEGRLIWDSSYRSSWKAIPIGFIPLLALLIFTAFRNVKNNYKLLLIIAGTSSISYLLAHDMRTLIVAAQVILLISTIEAMSWLFLKASLNWDKIQEYLFFIILSIIVIKFYTDIYYYFSYYMYRQPGMHPGWTGYPKEVLEEMGAVYQNAFCQPLFINKSIFIYNYFDYFQFIYIIGIFLVIKKYKKYPLLTTLVLLLSLFYLYYSTSRLWKVTLVIMPALLLVSKLRVSFRVLFFTAVCGWVVIISVAGYAYESIDLGKSINLRMQFITEFVGSLNYYSFFFPELSKNISAGGRSVHNEFLEIWYRCGLIVAVAFLWWVYLKLKEVAESDKFLAVLLLFVLVFGGIIQLNYLHLYTMLIISIFIAGVQTNTAHKTKNRFIS